MHTRHRAVPQLVAALVLIANAASACVLCEQGGCALHAAVVFGGGEGAPLAASEFEPGFPAFQINARWSSTATQPNFSGGTGAIGSPATITWGIVPDGTPINASISLNGVTFPITGPSNLRATFDGLYPYAGPPTDPLINRPWVQLYKQVFDRWSELGGVTFNFEPNNTSAQISTATGVLGVNADIRIGGQFIDGEVVGVPSIVAINYFPNNGDQVLDTANTLFYGNTQLNSLRFRNTVAHEIGHALGFNHVADIPEHGILMEPRIVIDFDGPQFDDILALHRNYGDRLEKNGGNDSAATATQVGVLSPGGSWSIGTSAGTAVVTPDQADFVSIDNLTDVDYYQFSVAQATLVDVRLAPVGPSYGLNGLTGDPLYVTSHLGDLSLELLANAQTVGFANLRGFGFAESILGLHALPGVIYHAVARSVSGQVQMYRLDITAVPEPCSAGLIVLACATLLCQRRRFQARYAGQHAGD